MGYQGGENHAKLLSRPGPGGGPAPGGGTHEAVHTPHLLLSPRLSPGAPPELDGVLEALARQNQLLLDILGAVNALSAAVLSIQSKL